MSRLDQYSKAYKPFSAPWAMQAAESHEKAHWGEWEVRLQEDVAQWKGGAIPANEKAHITQILRVFTQSDCAVASNYCDIFIPYFKNNEVRNMLLSFANREGTHQRAYSLLNDTLGMDEGEYSAFLRLAEMKDKIAFMTEPVEAPVDARQRMAFELARSVCNEGMSLFSAFVMLLNYQRFGKMRGMCEVVEWSIRDETMHIEGITRLFHAFIEENPSLVQDNLKAFIYRNYDAAVRLEFALIDLVYDGADVICDLAREDVKSYVKYLADRRLLQLGLKPIFGQKDNPLKWVDWIVSGDSVKNFFEGVVSDYSTDGMTGEWKW